MFVESLLAWYRQNARELPWRSQQSPYRTWVSEVMLQQTRVETVIPYFRRWMARFPDVGTLANADVREILALWEGLGYYSRARNLHKAAHVVWEEYRGQLPQTPGALQKLPGIGRYTSSAIASIAFNQNVAVVDGNVRRVLSRLFDLREPVRSAAGEEKIWKLAEDHLPQGKSAVYNQALMELGALICTPQNPACEVCPLLTFCQAKKLGVQEERPVKRPRKKVPHHTVTAAVIRRDGRVLLAQRPREGLLGGLWEFPGGTLEITDADLETCLIREIREELGVAVRVGKLYGKYQHAYTHFKITLHAFLCSLEPGEEPQLLEVEDLAWVRFDDLSNYPMGKVDRMIARKLMEVGLNGSV